MSWLPTTRSFPQREKAMPGENQPTLVEASLAWRYCTNRPSSCSCEFFVCYEAVRVVLAATSKDAAKL